MKHAQAQKDVRSVVIHNILMVLDIQLVSTNAEIVTNMVISIACATRREKHLTRNGLWSQDQPKHINFRIGPVYTQNFICGQVEESSSDDPFYLQVQLQSTQVETKIPAPQHLITYLAYKLKPHKKTHYLRASLDTCADVNIMPITVYKLVCKDPGCKKLAPSSKLEKGTHTTDKIKVIGSAHYLQYFQLPNVYRK